MKASFSSAEEFLEYVRIVYSNPIRAIQSTANLEFQRHHEEKVARLTEEGRIDLKNAATDPHDYIARVLWEDLLAVLPSALANAIGGKLIVGALDNISVNAACLRSPERFVAIVINTGLMTFFNKVGKILIASVLPESVTYCNRCSAKEVTPSLALKWYAEVCEHYKKTGEPLGPQIHLTPSAELSHAQQLHLWEIFVLCHELGHLTAGHLDRKENWAATPDLGILEIFREDESHEMETEADILGYIIARHYYYNALLRKPALDDQDDRAFYLQVSGFFDLLHMLGARESRSHPDPIDRICNIAAVVYGEPFAEKFAQTYGDQNLMNAIFLQPLKPIRTLRDFVS